MDQVGRDFRQRVLARTNGPGEGFLHHLDLLSEATKGIDMFLEGKGLFVKPGQGRRGLCFAFLSLMQEKLRC